MSFPLIPGGRGAYKAFTLIELLTVIAVIGILAAITFSVSQGVGRQSRIARAKTELGSLSTALETYRRYYGDYPLVNSALDTADKGIDPATFTVQSSDRAYNLFRALNGRYTPDQQPVERQITKAGAHAKKYGKAFVNPSLFNLERDESGDAPGTIEPLPSPVASGTTDDPDFANAILDPWGHRYLYFYRDMVLTRKNDWRASSYLLFSAGPDGKVAFPSPADLKAGNRPDPNNPDNVDNIYVSP